jgi:hypothetical protein
MSQPCDETNISSKSAPAPEALLVDKPWRIVNLSRATWCRLDVRGKTPASVPLPVRKKLYRRRDLDLWIEWGCPARKEFEARSAMHLRLKQ